MYKYYLRVDKDKNIIDAFSDGIKQPEAGDILYKDNQPERCFVLNLFSTGWNYIYDAGQIKAKTPAQIAESPEHIEYISTTQKESLINAKIREMAIEQLKADGVLDADGNVK